MQNAKLKMTKLEQVGIVALVAVIACFFYFKKIYEPECKKFKAVKEKWVKFSKEVETLKRKEGGSKFASASIKEKEEELRTAKAELKRVSVVLASRQDSSEILTRISCLATEHNLKIQEFLPVDANDIQDVEEVFFKRSFHSLIMVGEFLDFKEFLEGLGALPKLVIVEKVVVERKREEEFLKIILLFLI